MLTKIRLELARDHTHPVGSQAIGYEFTAPLDAEGKIDADEWHKRRENCRVRRFRPPEQGGLLHRIAFRGVWWTGGTDEQRYARACLGAIYVLWVLQGIVLQRSYLYVHVAEVMIGLAVWAGTAGMRRRSSSAGCSSCRRAGWWPNGR